MNDRPTDEFEYGEPEIDSSTVTVYTVGSAVKFIATVTQSQMRRSEGFYHHVVLTVASPCCGGSINASLTQAAVEFFIAHHSLPADLHRVACAVCDQAVRVNLDPLDSYDVSVFAGVGGNNAAPVGTFPVRAVREFAAPVIHDGHPNTLLAEVELEPLLDELESQCANIVGDLGWVQLKPGEYVSPDPHARVFTRAE